MSDPLLVVEDVTKRFGAVAALDGVSLRLARGAAHGVVGPNGSGKSSLLNCVAGHYTPSTGRIAYRGATITAAPVGSGRRRGIARTFQNLQLAASLTLEENAMLGPRRVRSESARRKRARDLLTEWGVADYADAYPPTVPYGVRKVAEIVRALLAEPDLLLLDEPAAGLSPHERADFAERLSAFHTAHTGTAVVLVEHDVAFVQRICSTLTVLDHGLVVRTGEAAEVMADPAVVRSFLGREPDDD
jgi:ABC-type branched-subunit amino acid transport system ATPase component